MYVRHGIRQFKKNLGMNLFVMVQMIIVLFAVVCMASVVMNLYQYYQRFEKYFSKDGWLIYTCYAVMGEDQLCTDSEQLENMLQHADVTACYETEQLDCSLKSGRRKADYRIYDHELVTSYMPALESGEWLTTCKKEKGVIPTVVSHNDYGIGVGDIIDFVERGAKNEEYTWQAKIVGVLEDGASIVGWPQKNINGDGDYRSMYTNYLLGEQGKPIFLMDLDAVKQEEQERGGRILPRRLANVTLIRYDNDISAQERAANDEILTAMMDTYMKYPMQEVRDNSMGDLKNSMKAYATIFAGAFILVLISTISISTIIIRQQMKTYSIFYICGMDWNGCVRMNQISTLLTAAMAGMSFVVLMLLFWGLGLFKKTVITFGMLQMLGCAGALLIYIILAGWIVRLVMSNKQAKNILTDNVG